MSLFPPRPWRGGFPRRLPEEAWRIVPWREGSNEILSSRFAAVRIRPASRDRKVSTPHPLEWPPILFDDHDRAAAAAERQSIVAPAQRSPAALRKATCRRTDDGMPVHSFPASSPPQRQQIDQENEGRKS